MQHQTLRTAEQACDGDSFESWLPRSLRPSASLHQQACSSPWISRTAVLETVSSITRAQNCLPVICALWMTTRHHCFSVHSPGFLTLIVHDKEYHSRQQTQPKIASIPNYLEGSIYERYPGCRILSPGFLTLIVHDKEYHSRQQTQPKIASIPNYLEGSIYERCPGCRILSLFSVFLQEH